MHTKIPISFPGSSRTLKGLLFFFLMSAVVGWLFNEFVPVKAGLIDQSLATIAQSEATEDQQGRGQANGQNLIYLPIMMVPREQTPFGVESNPLLTSGNLLQRTDDLGVSWVRVARIHWRELQPNEGDPINWEPLSDFENELLALRRTQLKPIVTVVDSPRWATILPTSCAAIREDKLDAFAQFMSAVVSRYSQAPFYVNYWEIGNEPDVDPAIGTDSIFGCWGDKNDEYYGGERYGNMLKVVAPAMRAANANIQIMLGGLLLDRPNTQNDNPGKNEEFLEGILRAGAAPYFDIVGYHNHTGYYAPNVDYSGPSFGPWAEYEVPGPAKGKPAFLRDVMARYGVSKPLFLNESTQRCPPRWSEVCENPPDEFFSQQPAFLTRMAVRSLNVDVMGYIWYTINGPSWENSGLLDGSGNRRPVYYAYQTMVEQIGTAAMTPPQQVDSDYAQGIEAYRFRESGKFIDVLWSVDGTPITVSVPQSKYIAASDHLGAEPETSITNGQVQLTVGFHTIYIQRRP